MRRRDYRQGTEAVSDAVGWLRDGVRVWVLRVHPGPLDVAGCGTRRDEPVVARPVLAAPELYLDTILQLLLLELQAVLVCLAVLVPAAQLGVQLGIDGRRGLSYGDDTPRVVHGFVDLQQLPVPTLQLRVIVHHLDPLTVGEAQKLVAAGVLDGNLPFPDVHTLDTGRETPVIARPFESGCGEIAPSMHLNAVELVLQPLVSAA